MRHLPTALEAPIAPPEVWSTDSLGKGRDVLMAVCESYNLSEEAILAKGRDPYVVAARSVLCSVLVHVGYTVAAVARVIGCSHSTVVHAVAKQHKDPVLAKKISQLALYVEGHPNEWVLRAIAPQSRIPVRTCVERVLDGHTFGLAAYAGLVHLALHPASREVVGTYLAACGQEAHMWRIKLHALNLGLPWVEQNPFVLPKRSCG